MNEIKIEEPTNSSQLWIAFVKLKDNRGHGTATTGKSPAHALRRLADELGELRVIALDQARAMRDEGGIGG